MTHRTVDEFRRSAGLGEPVKTVSVNPPPPSAAAHARTTIGSLAAILDANKRTNWTTAQSVDGGFELRRHPDDNRVVKVMLPDTGLANPHVEALFDEERHQASGAFLDAESGTVLMDFRATPIVRVDLPAVVYLFMRQDDTADPVVEVQFYAPSSTVQEDTIEIPPFLADWTKCATANDAWLVEHVRNLGSRGPVFAVVAGVGTWVRLRTDDTLLIKEALAKTLRGDVDETFAQPWRWVRDVLTAARHQALVRRVNARCARLQEGFADVIDAQTDEPAEHVADLLNDRDDVESIRMALRQATGRDELAETLKPLDLIGERYVLSSVVDPMFATDKRLHRVAVRFPESWWGQPAREAE